MQKTEVILPGGLSNNGCLERQAKFRPLNGIIEQALIELGKGSDRPGYVTTVLSSTLDSIGDQQVNANSVENLCVADRQYLMLRLAALLDGEQMWLQVDCGFCAAPFDVEVRRSDLPVKEAGQNYPLVTLQLRTWTLEICVPTGADQERIRELADDQAIQQLLQSCIHLVNDEPPTEDFISKLTDSDIEEIDQALDKTSPAVCNQLLVNCPECGREQNAVLDHYELPGMDRYGFYDEVHMLASHYHWSEAAILDLPQTRRRLYLGKINRAVGIDEQGVMT